MPICIECRAPVATLYSTYSKADDRTLGKGVRLTQCPRCGRFADKYVEHDFVVLFIDLVLIKPQVWRHLLFNRLAGNDGEAFDPSIVRFGVLLMLFDVYLTWARVEKAYPQTSPLHRSPLAPPGIDAPGSSSSSAAAAAAAANGTDLALPGSSPGTSAAPQNLLTTQPILLQYLFFLVLCTLCTVSFHLPIRLLAAPAARLRRETTPPAASTTASSTAQPGHHASASHSSSASSSFSTTGAPQSSSTTNNAALALAASRLPNRVSTALLVSSITKLFPILMVVWDYDLPSSASAVAWAVIANNVAALEILLDCGWLRSLALVAVGVACRAAVAWAVLRGVGLEMSRIGGLDSEGGGGGVWGTAVGLFGLV